MADHVMANENVPNDDGVLLAASKLGLGAADALLGASIAPHSGRKLSSREQSRETYNCCLAWLCVCTGGRTYDGEEEYDESDGDDASDRMCGCGGGAHFDGGDSPSAGGGSSAGLVVF